MHNFSNQNKIILVKAGQASGTTAITSDVVDTQNFQCVTFVGSVTTANAGTFAKVQQGAASNLSDAADLKGTKLVPGDNGDSFLIEVVRPIKRYLRVHLTRGAATVTGDIYAVLSGPRTVPVTHGSTIDSELHASPDEGTA